MTRWYLHGDLPPTGNPVVLRPSPGVPAFAGYATHLVNSGTAALALALIVARNRQPARLNPTVILPAYACPDLVAAAEFAGVRPVLVDVGADDPGYSLPAVAAALTADTVAVVAVNFLGIRERLQPLKALLAQASGPLLIEDDAQWFPEPMQQHGMVGDLACVSFGRGKPVSLLGGGALLVREGSGLEVPSANIAAAQDEGGSYAWKARAFNLLLDRRWYWSINRNPLFTLGQTVFKPLSQIAALSAVRRGYLASNVETYLAQTRAAEAEWMSALAPSAAVVPLAAIQERAGRLLRFPVLCRDAAARDKLLERLQRAGLGATALYRKPLVQIEGVGAKVEAHGACPGAASFAARLLTLPVHAQVHLRDVHRAARLLAG